MQEDFHYYATYCAAFLAGYSHEESLDICYSANFVDHCTKTILNKIKAPITAATTQLQGEMVDLILDKAVMNDITRIWASFHFLPGDLYANVKRGTKIYKNKYRLICHPNGELVREMITLTDRDSLQAQGLAMHVLADTWAHSNFAGTPSFAINNTNSYFYELIPNGNGYDEVKIAIGPRGHDHPDGGTTFSGTPYTPTELTILNLGHGRAGHLPDYSYFRFKYLPAWGDYREIVKDNPSDYMKAFRQMVYAMKYFRGEVSDFALDTYDAESVDPYADEIMTILEKRQLNANADWKAFGEKLSGCTIPDYDIEKYQNEYKEAAASEKDQTFIGRFITAAIHHKGMVTNRVYKSGNNLCGVSIELEPGINDLGRITNPKEVSRKISREGKDLREDKDIREDKGLREDKDIKEDKA